MDVSRNKLHQVQDESHIVEGNHYLIIVKECKHALYARSASGGADSFFVDSPRGWYSCRSCGDDWHNSWDKHLYFQVGLAS